MRFRTARHILLSILLTTSSIAFGGAIDSLRIAYDYAETIEERCDIKEALANVHQKENNYDQAIFHFQGLIELLPPTETERKADILLKIGKLYRKKEDVKNCIKSYELAKNWYTQTKAPPEKIAYSLGRLGRAYYSEAQYDSAMFYYMDAKEVYETNNIENEDYGNLLHYIGSVFKRQDNQEKACEYYNSEIEFGKKNGFKEIEVEGMYLSGICAESDSAALILHHECLKIYTELESENMQSLMYQLIAGAYQNLGNEDSTTHYLLKALEYRRKDKTSKSHLSSLLASIGSSYLRKGNINKAEEYMIEAQETCLMSEIKQDLRLQEIYSGFYDIYMAKGNYKKAVEYLNLYYAYRDSARDASHQDAIQEMELIYNDEQQKAQLAIVEKDRDLAQKESILAQESEANQALLNKLYLGGGLIVLILGGFVFIKYKESKKQQIIISAQTKQMQFQKELVEAKNKDITDSMVYASSIQQAILTSKEYISKMFSEFFVFYRPRDIVSGDFYWAYETNNKRFIAVGDCTGHGVPGAMMSMLGNAFLNEIVIESKIQEPSEVLNKLRSHVKRAMGSDKTKDGMDMSFCCIEGNRLTFAGANLPLYYISNNELTEIKGNKQPIGYQPIKETPFEQTTITLNAGDKIYLFSDGYADQFGGEKGKKYKYKTFRDRLFTISSETFNMQQSIVNEEFETWKGDFEQLDDVCVIGIKV